MQEYAIMANAKVTSMPADVVVFQPTNCPLTYEIYQTQPSTQGAGGNAIDVRITDGQMTFFYDNLDLIAGKAYEYFTVYIKVSMPNGAAAAIPFYLKLSSPCMDVNMVSITVPALELIEYGIGQSSTYVHDPVVINATEDIKTLCGPPVVTALFVGRTVPDPTYDFFTYDSETRTITVDTSDASLTGMGTQYGLRAYLPGYDPATVANAIFDE
jgi:hypothetical protein